MVHIWKNRHWRVSDKNELRHGCSAAPPALILIAFALSLTSCQRGEKNPQPSESQQNKPISSGTPAADQNPQNQPDRQKSNAGAPPQHSTKTFSELKESQPLCGQSDGANLADTSAQKQVRFATFNMLGAFSSSLPSLDVRLAMIAKNIFDAQADVIGVQEAEDMTPAGLSIEKLSAALTKLSGETWYWCFFRSNPHVPLEADVNVGGGGPLSVSYARLLEGNTKKLRQNSWFMGDAILSRLPFGSAGARRISPRVLSELPLCQTEQCKSFARGESRVVIRAEILLQDRSFHFFNSHFYTDITPESAKSQTQQAAEISSYVSEVAAKKSAPSALACDCNSPVGGAVGNELLKQGFSAKESRIFPDSPAASPADPNILWPSDHLGVVAGPF